MPWCEPCAKYLAPAGMTGDGRCPVCGTEAETPDLHGRITAETLDLAALAGREAEKVPWHFKLLVVLLCAYLGWRLVDLFL